MSATIPVVPSLQAEPGDEYAPVPAAPAATPWMSVTSLVLGLVSIVAGWTLFAPIAGLIVGILALKREPANRTMSIWGIALNGVLLAGVLLVTLGALLFGLVFLPFAFLPFEALGALGAL
jgi:hypothetical protein